MLNYQADFKTGDQKAIAKIYTLGKTIALKYINEAAKRNKHVAYMSFEEKEEKAHNAITYIVVRYVEHKDWFIENSFTAYLYLRVKHELFYKRKVDGIVDFVDTDKLKKRWGK